MTIPYTYTDTSLTLVIDFQPRTIARTHVNFEKIIQLLIEGAGEDEILPLIDIPAAIVTFMQGNVEIRDRVVYYKGVECNTKLASHIIRFMEANDPKLVGPLVAFLDNVMENPSYRAAQDLFDWVQRANLPTTSDGHLLAWKRVRNDYLDEHSRTFDNSVGKIVEIPRNQCDEDPTRTCSYGLHFCSYDYLPQYGAEAGNYNHRVMVIKINPRDIVAFPTDYQLTKGRCCRYEVVGEVPHEKVREFFPNSPVYDGFDNVPVHDEAPAPAPKFGVGQIWRTRDGSTAEITHLRERLSYPLRGTVGGRPENWTEDGMVYRSIESSHDLVEFIRNDRTPEFEVGQRWRTRTGDIVRITYMSDIIDVEFEGGQEVTLQLNGRYYSDGEDDEWDLVEFVA